MIIEASHQLTHFTHLNLFQVDYKDRMGKDKQWIYASRSNAPSMDCQMVPPLSATPDAVVIVPFHRDIDKLVLIREFRVPLRDLQYGFPAGLMDRGERVEETARRELKEETGLDITQILSISPPIYSSSGMTDESVSLVYAFCTGSPTTIYNEASEDITVLTLSQNEAKTLIETPDIKFDVKTWIVLSTFAKTGSIL